MADKPTTAAGYTPEHLEFVRATCLYVATKLGDLMDDLVIVGGLAPSLLIDQVDLPEGADAHVGTTDLDVGLTVALLDQQRYTALTERLRRAGFSPDVNEDGNPTRQRWKIEETVKVTVGAGSGHFLGKGHIVCRVFKKATIKTCVTEIAGQIPLKKDSPSLITLLLHKIPT